MKYRGAAGNAIGGFGEQKSSSDSVFMCPEAKRQTLGWSQMETEENTTNETNMSAVEIPAPPVKKRGRPPKNKTEPVTQSEEASPNEENIPDEGAPPPKKRGRKSKAELAALAASRTSQSDAGSPPLSPSSEKRTRAPAYSYAEYSDASEASEDDEAPVAKSPKSSPKRPATTTPRFVANSGLVSYSELQTAADKGRDRDAGTLVIRCTSRGRGNHEVSFFLGVFAQQARCLGAADNQGARVAISCIVHDRLEFTV
ncbi:hypothetical protein Y032_0030g2128 [Ancylostoma ceylanicum]|uniref:Uncharacterized protein n=1 Tax=Ancylostoma ceylanicum TaxID=53326 RepID=A0A016UQX0_9BILA|nr:hypothetical protein Y032_0030g2128 [Ancylostoma ceylanicum]